MDDTLPVESYSSPITCALCHQLFSSETDQIDLESINICGDCKFLFLEETGTSSQHIPRITSRIIRQTRYNNSYNSSESIEDMFSQQFSTMINLARHNHPPAVSDTSSRTTTPVGSRRFRRVVSDTESDGYDSVYGESDDVISYGGDSDSDVSVDVHSFLVADSDTDIDPMHAGLNQWSSDEDNDRDNEEWEEINGGDNTLGSLVARVHLQRSMASNGQSPEIEGSIRVRISERYIGNSGDYLDARSFEDLLERLAESDNSRRGAPPAAQSFVDNLDLVVVNGSDHGGLVCAICKESLTVGGVVNRLPCLHLYHPSCIKPWLSSRNSCPLCRFELPTDDIEYENRKRNGNRELVSREIEVQDDVSFEERGNVEIVNGGGRWLFMAAPVVSLVGIGLALWLGNHGAVRSLDLSQRGNRSRRWWSLF